VILLTILFGIGILAGKYLLFSTPTVLLIKESVPVYYKTSPEEDFLEFTGDSMRLPFNSTLKTEAGGRAYLIWGQNNLLALDENTEVLTRSQSDFLVINGNVWFHLENQTSVNITTPDLLASGAANEFITGISDSGYSKLVMIEGEMPAGTFMQIDSGISFKQTELIKEGEMLLVSKDIFSKQEVTEEESSSYWYRRVMLLKDKVNVLKNLELEFYNEIIKKINFILADLLPNDVLGIQTMDISEQISLLKSMQDQFLIKNWGILQCPDLIITDFLQAQDQLMSLRPSNRKIAAAISSFLNYLDLTSGVCNDLKIAPEERETLIRLDQETINQIAEL